MSEMRVQDKTIQAGRNKKELGIYLDKSMITFLELEKEQPILLTADKAKNQIIIQIAR